MIEGYQAETTETTSNMATAKGQSQIFFLNHHRDPVDGLVERLRATGYQVRETGSIVETHRVLARHRPDLVVLNPLVMQPASTELELLEELQRNDNPVPVIVLVDDLESFHAANSGRISIRDFMAQPHSPDELVHRVQLALLHRSKYLDLHERAQELEGQVSIDFKTNLISERHFKSILTMEFKRSQRHGNAVALLLVDVDNFKAINDTTDYAFGDDVLIQVAAVLRKTIRATDYAARFGGDEFVLLLPHTTPAEAVQTAIRVRKAVSGLIVESRGFDAKVTVSIGIGTFDGRATGSPEELRRHANKALQEAKQRGKNQVWLYSHASEAASGAGAGQVTTRRSSDASSGGDTGSGTDAGSGTAGNSDAGSDSGSDTGSGKTGDRASSQQ